MKRTLTALLFALVISLPGKSQSSYCLTFAEYQARQYHPIENLRMEYRSGSKSLWNGGASYKPLTGNKKTDKTLKKDARFIVFHDSLYINCRKLSCQGVVFGNWYARAWLFHNEYILFTALNINSVSQTRDVAFLFGAIGGAIAAAKNRDDYCCYIYYPNAETVEIIDQQMVNRLLEEHPELQQELDKADPKKRFTPETLLPILRKLGLIATVDNPTTACG